MKTERFRGYFYAITRDDDSGGLYYAEVFTAQNTDIGYTAYQPTEEAARKAAKNLINDHIESGL
jgi:hypothetical protein